MKIVSSGSGGTIPQNPVAAISPPDFQDYWESQQSFERMGAFVGQKRVINTSEGSLQADGALVSRDFFATLNVAAALGRTLEATDFEVAAAPAIVLSSEFF